ncbi:MAG: DUF3108 domain-containing protein [Gallionella sp.]|nr:DUF3108 domain-containing protein [Gallionella sp.]
MSAALRTPIRRVALAIALSALIHAAILWLPQIQFPHAAVQLPPLTARLEHLPEPVTQPAEKPEPANPGTVAGASGKPTTGAMPAMDKTEEPIAPRPFPKHLQLTFAVYQSEDGFKTGEIQQQLDIGRNRYTLKAIKRTAGLTSLRTSIQLIQTSRGRIVAQGLQPEIFKQEKFSAGGKQDLEAAFDRAAQKLRFSSGNDTALPADAQDMLSFTYQLSQLPMKGEYFPLPVSDGSKLETYEIEVGRKEDITTPMGKLRTLRLRKMHDRNEAYFEIWLGLEYRLLPVKIRQIDRDGQIAGVMVVSDIRVADE